MSCVEVEELSHIPWFWEDNELVVLLLFFYTGFHSEEHSCLQGGSEDQPGGPHRPGHLPLSRHVCSSACGMQNGMKTIN